MEESEVYEPSPAQGTLERVPVATILRGLALAATALGLVLGGHAYLATRLIGGLGLAGIAAQGVWLGTWTLFLSLFLGFFARRLPRAWSRPAHLFAYGWMGLFALSLFATAAVDLLSLVAALLEGKPTAGRFGPAQVALVAALVIPSAIWGAVRAVGRARVERVDVPIAGLPADLEGYRIVQISDLHVGDTMGRRWAQRLADQVNALDPDAIAITGDMADGSAAKVRAEVAPLATLKAKDGVFWITGNHEYFNGLGGWLGEARRLGFRVLLNEHHVVQRGGARLVIAGVTDYNAGEFLPEHASQPAAALEGAPAGAPRVLLAHQPRSAYRAAGLGVDLQLSGHTHGGQFFPWRYFVRLQQPVLAGMANVGGVRVYTHRGTGFWGPPLRLMAPPEIAVLRLVKG